MCFARVFSEMTADIGDLDLGQLPGYFTMVRNGGETYDRVPEEGFVIWHAAGEKEKHYEAVQRIAHTGFCGAARKISAAAWRSGRRFVYTGKSYIL